MKVFLDDIRLPKECTSYMHKRIGALNPLYLEEWIVVRNYDDFTKVVSQNIDKVTHISFDHDLGEDVAQLDVEKGLSKRKARAKKKESKSGYDCAKWLKEHYVKNNVNLPIMFVHSMNPVGTENIINLFKTK